MGEYYFLVDSAGNATEVAGEIKVGRNKTSELVISDPLASRHHATVYMDGETLMIRDEGSSNGTYVNGAQIYEPVVLNDQDKIQFGDEEYIVRAPLWDTATLRAPMEGEELTADAEAAPKKMTEASSGPQQEPPSSFPSEVLEDDVVEPPQKNNNKIILIIAAAVILLCICCLVIAGFFIIVSRNAQAVIDMGVGFNQIELFAMQVLSL